MRPEILFPLFTPLTSLKGVGSKIAPLLTRVAGERVRDLVFLGPQSIVHRARASVAGAVEGEVQIFRVSIIGHLRPARAIAPWRIQAFDGSAFLTLTYFKGHGPHLERAHPPGAERVVSGRVERFGSEIQIVHPDYLIDVARAEDIPEFEAIYPATAGLNSRTVRKLALEALALAPDLPEWQDAAWMERQRWPTWRAALSQLHAPRSEGDLSPQAPHRRRLAYDELLAHQLALAQRKTERRAHPAPVIRTDGLAARVEAALPFRLTGAQQQALADIRGDLRSGRRMNRLVQGDVGAGKTVVAMLAMADTAAAGLQSALMAPTEILARQHFETLAAPLASQGARAVLLTGRDKGAGRTEKLARLADGSACVAVGTHALFQDDVVFRSLALTVIDEQHRFGVSERARLRAKAESAHLLAMSATPIPRTLELTLFGDVDVSRLKEKPPGRTPVTTRAAPMSRLGEIVARLRSAVRSGAQAFWICPLVSDSELVDLAAAESRAAALIEVLGSGVGLVHGRLTPAAKDAVMADFVEGRISVLVATTVIEVGVDVPAASIMVIEQAERFGLAQLHQLRGRVGRGAAESSCVLLYDPPLSEIATRRLDVLRKTDDGFLIAEMDLELRGGGDPLGLKQSGFPAYRLADPVAHRDLIPVAADDARLILSRDPELSSKRGHVLRILRELFDWRADSSINEAG
jgi:ATP-dependent DNA helicase RecG